MIRNFKKRFSVAFLCGCILLQGMPLTVMAAEPDIIRAADTEESQIDDSEDTLTEAGDLPSGDIADEPSDDTEDLSSDDAADEPSDNTEGLSSGDTADEPSDDTEDLPSDDAADEPSGDTEDLASDDAADETSADLETSPDYDTSVTSSASTEELVREDVNAALYQEGALSVETLTKPDVHTHSITSYESQIAEAQQYIYEQLLARAEKIVLSDFNIPSDIRRALYDGVLNEHPELYYVDGAFRYSAPDGYLLYILPQYTSGYDDEAFSRAVKQALSHVDSSMSDMEKAIVLHDYIAINCQYDTTLARANCHSAYGALAEQVAVCQGYALAYKYLLNQVGIECLMVTSTELNHAWNMVKLDGEYYQVDTTWDDPTKDRLGRARHFYMFVSDEAFLDANDRKHNADDWQIVKDGYIADVSATDTRYDDYFWKNIDAPFVIDAGTCYYINSSKQLVQGDLKGSVSKVIQNSLGTWRTWDNTGSWSGTYSGLYSLSDQLYYNKTDGIYRINKAGTNEKKVYSVDTTSGYIYGSALVYNCAENRYQINYVIATTPNFTGSELIYEAVLEDATYPAVIPKAPGFTVNGATLDIDGGILVDAGTSVSIDAEDDAQIYYTTDGSIPTYGGLLYTEPLVIHQDTTIKSIAYRDALSSNITEETYVAADNNLILSETEITLKEGEENRLTATKLPTTRATSDIIWSSSANSVASVDLNGNIRALKKGQTTITATVADWQDRTVTAECKVTVTAQDSEPDPEPINEFTVTFLGFDGEMMKAETVQEGEDATPPTVPEVPGYRFAGWDGNYTAVTKDEIVTAQYEIILYKITYILTDGDKGNNPDSYTVESEDITLEDAVGGREGYYFVGWYDNEDYIGVPLRTISKDSIPEGSTDDIILYGRWKNERELWMKWDGVQEGSPYITEYTGSALKPVFSVYYGDTPLQAGTDYSVTYKNNTKAWQTDKDEKELTSAEKSKAPSVVIKGKGNYSGTVTSIFQIAPKNIAEDAEVYAIAAAYNNKVQKSVPKVVWGKTTLKNSRDFTVSYPDEGEENPGAYREPAQYRIIVEGTGNYCGQIESSITIVATNAKDENAPRLISKAKVTAIPAQEYSEKAVNLEELGLPVIKYSGKQLTEGVDYKLDYGNDCKEIGTYPLKIIGMGQYVGEIHTTFKIQGLSASTMKVTGIVNQVYDGTEKTQPQLTITDKSGNPLTEGTDYEIDHYEKNVEVGTAQIVITGKGKYSGTVKKTFKITALSLADIPAENLDIRFVRGTADTQLYEKGGAKPKLQIIYHYTDDESIELTEGVHYSLSYKNNTGINPKEGKEPYILVNGKKNFKNSVKVDFRIVSADIAAAVMTAADVQENTKAGKFYSTPVLKDTNGKKLVKGTDYEATFRYTDQYGNELTKDSKPGAGTKITVTVTGKNNYTGTNQTTYRIYRKGKNISSAKVTVQSSFVYSGEPIYLSKSDLVIKLNGESLNPEDYEIDRNSYVNNNKKGTAKVTIKGKGDYAGTKTISFKIKAHTMKWWEYLASGL